MKTVNLTVANGQVSKSKKNNNNKKNTVMKTQKHKLMQECINWYRRNILDEQFKDRLFRVKDYNFEGNDIPCLFFQATDTFRHGIFFFFTDNIDNKMLEEIIQTKNYTIKIVNDFEIFRLTLLEFTASYSDKIYFLDDKEYRSSKELKNECLQYCKRLLKSEDEIIILDINLTNNPSMQFLLITIKGYRGCHKTLLFGFATKDWENDYLKNLNEQNHTNTFYIINKYEEFVYYMITALCII